MGAAAGRPERGSEGASLDANIEFDMSVRPRSQGIVARLRAVASLLCVLRVPLSERLFEYFKYGSEPGSVRSRGHEIALPTDQHYIAPIHSGRHSVTGTSSAYIGPDPSYRISELNFL